MPEWITVLAAVLGGGALARVYDVWANRGTRLTAQVQAFYETWSEETKRLRTAINELHVLVAALESEIVALGGDPIRVRLAALRGVGPTHLEDPPN